MTFTLESHGRTLGRTGTELPSPAPGTRSWHFLPTAEFAEVRPLFAELPTAMEDSQEVIPTQGELEAIPEEDRERWMRDLFLSDPRMARFVELSGQLEALALALVDASGRQLDTNTIGVTELDIPADAFRGVLSSVEPGAHESVAAGPPFYLLVAGVA